MESEAAGNILWEPFVTHETFLHKKDSWRIPLNVLHSKNIIKIMEKLVFTHLLVSFGRILFLSLDYEITMNRASGRDREMVIQTSRSSFVTLDTSGDNGLRHWILIVSEKTFLEVNEKLISFTSSLSWNLFFSNDTIEIKSVF